MSTPGLKVDRPPNLRDRSPRPYIYLDADLLKQSKSRSNSFGGVDSPWFDYNASSSVVQSRRSSAPEHEGSESGTEADDERPQLLALPPASIRPRKGYKRSDGTVSPLLTPTQLDWEDHRLSKAFSDDRRKSRRAKEEDEGKLEAERVVFDTRRRAERIRRLSEVILLGVIGLAVVYGGRIWKTSWQWYLVEVLSQLSAIAGLIAFYPLRLVSVEHNDGHVHIWSRFRVPASFDPATVLYPTFLPVLISLSLVHHTPETFLPNAILGLASLPQRLFPQWALVDDINTLHWMISLVPLLTSRAANLAASKFPSYLTQLQPPESSATVPTQWLVLLFPLHQAMLPSLNYLTTTSLLPAEKQLLATALVDVLLFAVSPQTAILRSTLLVGGICLLVTCSRVLSWNVSLARVPTWRLRNFQRSSLTDSLTKQVWQEVVSMALRLFGKFSPEVDSDSEEDDLPTRAIKPQQPRSPSLAPAVTFNENFLTSVSGQKPANGHAPSLESGRRDSKVSVLRRRNTISSPMADAFDQGLSRLRSFSKATSRRRDWVRELTPFKATLRKRLYAAYIYMALLIIVLIPVRDNISKYALSGQEPLLWAFDYAFAGFPTPSQVIDYINSHNLPSALQDMASTLSSATSAVDFRTTISEPNTRLLLVLYYAIILIIGLTAVLILSPLIEVDTRRKIFHAIMVAMFLPSIYIDPCFCALALALVLAAFLVLEVIRGGQIPPLGTAIGRFVAPYVDGRDLRGPMVVSHVFLLVGCAIPFWLSLAAFERTGTGRWAGWELEGDQRETAMLAGVVCVGMGDAAASLIGRRFGRRKWPWIGGKSLEGSASFAFAVCLGLSLGKMWLRMGGWTDVNALDMSLELEVSIFLVKALAAGCGASFMEAVLTGANDNVVVPVALWLLCRGMRI